MPVQSVPQVRLLLLVVATSLFAAVWMSDRPARLKTTVTAKPRPHVAALASAEVASAPLETAPVETLVAAPSPSQIVTVSDAVPTVAGPRLEVLSLDAMLSGDVAIPEGIAAGEYRVVGTGGTVYSLTLAPADLVYLGLGDHRRPAESYYVVGEREAWYFVRVSGPHGRSLAQAWVIPATTQALGRIAGTLIPAAARCGRIAATAGALCAETIRAGLTVMRDAGREVILMGQSVGEALRRIEWSSRIAAEPADAERL